jgi:hypothetical protein
MMENLIGWLYKMQKYLVGYFHLQEIHILIQYYLSHVQDEINLRFII